MGNSLGISGKVSSVVCRSQHDLRYGLWESRFASHHIHFRNRLTYNALPQISRAAEQELRTSRQVKVKI